MTSVLNVDTIADKAGTGPVALTKQQAAKAYVHSTDAGAAQDSFNVASFTDHGVGDWQYSFTNSMSTSTFPAPSTAASGGQRQVIDYSVRKATTAMGSAVASTDGLSAADRKISQVSFGDLA